MTARGGSLLEVAVALLLLSFGALAVAAGIAHGQRSRTRALDSALALAAAEAWLEAWRSGPWRPETTGSQGIAWGPRAGAIAWEVVPRGACLAEARVEAIAAGASRAPVVLVTRRFAEGAPCADALDP
ncbi:MAG: hypothetical protein ABR559_02410 [Gemmatimonadota bacterium]